jgi:hypothetical protein
MSLGSVVEFFRNLPPKQCSCCGQEVREMHDCYTHQCETCETEGLK